MDEYNWKHTFPKVPEQFHEKVVSTLENLPEEEENESMRIKKMAWKKRLVMVLAATFVLGMTAFAASRAAYTTSVSSSQNEFQTLPTAKEVKKLIGADAKLIDSFSNGYTFAGGNVGTNSDFDENDKVIGSYKSLYLAYNLGDDNLSMFVAPTHAAQEEVNSVQAATINDIPVFYSFYDNKVVPGDYVQTEQDKADEASGKYVFSYGSDDVEIIRVQYLGWDEDGVNYGLLAMNSTATQETLVQMAKEVIESSVK
ncbi:MAG: signal peptide protein [Lachnospiraceae bacterium]|nr:signal peptide protein [Lachnospiraceae bacterium]